MRRRPSAWRNVLSVTFATEAWPAVFGGLIPLAGLVGVGYVVYRAVREDDDDG